MNPVRPAPSRGRLRWTLRMPRPVAVRDAGAACLARGRQWPQGGAGCTAAPARGREPPPAWNSRARRAGGMGDAPQSRAQRRGNAARHGRCSLRCAGCWTELNPREASARQNPVKVLDERGNELALSTGWGWFYLSTVLDDFSRYIIAWKLCATMKVGDVTETLDLALQASGLDHARVVHRPRLLSDNGPSHISSDLAEWLDKRNMGHVRGAPSIRRHRGRSNAGIKRSRTASCWKTIIYPATSNPGSTPSSITTTIAVITRTLAQDLALEPRR
jgi:transposase InsO family protein